MDNQHQKIKGYRDLTQPEIDLMNEIKSIEASIATPQSFEQLKLRYCQALHQAGIEGHHFVQKLQAFEGCWNNAFTFLQTGFMWAVRGIAQPQPQTPAPKVEWHFVDDITVGEELLTAEAQLLVESTEGRSLMTGADLRAAYAEQQDGADVPQYVRFLFLDQLPV